ncbi:hypothetical protein Indivirus_10_16, partial [Indivirus ILV1]
PIKDTCDYVNVSRIHQFIITNTPKNGGKKCPSKSIMSGKPDSGCD